MKPSISWSLFNPATLTLMLLVPMLTACGGGGQGNLQSSPVSLSGLEYPVGPASARQAVAGSIAPTQTAAQAVQRLYEIARNADEIVTTDAVLFQPAKQSRFPLACTGRKCSGTYKGKPYSINLTTPSSANLNEMLDHDVAEIQPVMVHNGVHIGQIRARDRDGLDALYYGGWMEHSSFAVTVFYSPDIADPEFAVGIAYSMGDGMGTNPVAVAGRTATWTGSVVGGDYSSQYAQNVIQGTATITADFDASNVDVEFSSLVDLDDADRMIDDMNWDDIPVSGGEFSQGSGENLIRGEFYGPGHEEVGGAFDRNQILGAFGAVRGTQ